MVIPQTAEHVLTGAFAGPADEPEWMNGVVLFPGILNRRKNVVPQIYDLPQLHRQMIEVLGIKNADKLVPTADDAKPTDPVSENMDALIGKPIKAFIYQDHNAHIATHMAFMQDPMIAQTIGQNPQAQRIMMSLQAHIAEHLGFNYRKQLEEKLGAPLPAPNAELPEEMEVELSRLVAQAGQQLTQTHQQQAAAQQAQQQAQDPIVQMQQAELQLKAQEQQRKAQKDMADLQLRAAEQQRKAQKDQMDAALETQRLQLDQTETALEAQKDGIKLKQARQQADREFEMKVLQGMQNQQNQGPSRE